MSKEISAVDVYKEAWSIFTKSPGNLIITMVLFIIVSLIPSAVQQIVSDNSLLSTLVYITSIIINGILTLGLIDIVFQLIKTGEIHISNLFNRTDLLPKYLAAYIVFILAMFFGFLALIIPGIIIAVKFSFFSYILVHNEKIEPIDALKRSWLILSGHHLDLIVFYLLTFIIAFFGIVFTCGIGTIVIFPLIIIANCVFYLELEKDYSINNSSNLDTMSSIEE